MELNDLADYDYYLPKELIALGPKKPRSESKLLVYSSLGIVDSRFKFLTNHLKPKDRLIFNDTKVLSGKLDGLRSRLHGSRTSVAKIEILLIECLSINKWRVFCKPLKKVKLLDKIVFSSSLSAEVISKAEGGCVLRFSESGNILKKLISELGKLPVPPYITKNRGYRTSDEMDYQSIFAKKPGAIAAPTASLHFEQFLLDKLKAAGIFFSFVTLHVGAGTFLPVKSENISDHKMHFETGSLSNQTAMEINQTIKDGGRIIPVGTTCLRLIESAASDNGIVTKFSGKTNIFIKPGYKFKVSNGLITNFHFPKSTLLMLISAFVGNEERKKIYNHALRNKYRFFSYGDGSLLLPES